MNQPPNIRLMAIALIQDGIGQLDATTETTLDRLLIDGSSWREYMIRQLNGFDLPADFVKLAILKKWQEFESQDTQAFTEAILDEWGLLP